MGLFSIYNCEALNITVMSLDLSLKKSEGERKKIKRKKKLLKQGFAMEYLIDLWRVQLWMVGRKSTIDA